MRLTRSLLLALALCACGSSTMLVEPAPDIDGSAPPVADAGAMPNERLLAVGEHHTCAVGTDGALRCWGLNHLGQLGDGTRLDHARPAVVPGVEDVVELVAGRN